VLLFNHIRPEGNDRNQILPIGYWQDIELKDGMITAVPRTECRTLVDKSDSFPSLCLYSIRTL